MKKQPILHHNAYYLYQGLIFFLGFFCMIFMRENVSLQFMVLSFMLTSYIALGFIHHSLNHDLHTKIVVEYILISSVILSAFLFFNAGRI